MRKLVTLALLLVSLTGSLLRLIPIPFSMGSIWLLGVAAHELTSWFILPNLIGALVSYRWSKAIAAIFVASLLYGVWPWAQIPWIEGDLSRQWKSQGFAEDTLHLPAIGGIFARSFNPGDSQEVVPTTLPTGTLFYKGASSVTADPLPIIVEIHGGAWKWGGPQVDGAFSSYFASHGYAVFAIDYRKAPQSQFPAQLDDVQAAIAWIHTHAAEYGADPYRIALAGFSAGGHLAMLAGYANDRVPIRAVVSFYGPTDLTALHSSPPQPYPVLVSSMVEDFLGGTPGQIKESYRRASPLNQVEGKLPPTLQIQGQQDHIVTPALARGMHQRLLTNGTRTILLELPWSEHSFDFVYFGPGNTLALTLTDSFLAETMQP